MKIPESEHLYGGETPDSGESFLSGLSPWEIGLLTAACLENSLLSEIPLSQEHMERLQAYDNQLQMLTEDARYLLCLTVLSRLEVTDDG